MGTWSPPKREVATEKAVGTEFATEKAVGTESPQQREVTTEKAVGTGSPDTAEGPTSPSGIVHARHLEGSGHLAAKKVAGTSPDCPPGRVAAENPAGRSPLKPSGQVAPFSAVTRAGGLHRVCFC